MRPGFIGQEISASTLTPDSSSLSAVATATTSTSHQPSQTSEPSTSACIPVNMNVPEPRDLVWYPNGIGFTGPHGATPWIVMAIVVPIYITIMVCWACGCLSSCPLGSLRARKRGGQQGTATYHKKSRKVGKGVI